MPAPYIALVSNTATFDAVTHARRDLMPVSLEVSQEESELCYVRMEVKNPSQALTEKRVLISTNSQLLFDGIIQTVPRGLLGQVITLEAIGTTPDPATLQSQIDTLGESLKVAPFWDVLCVPQGREDDWSEILAARSQVLAHSRIQGAPFLCDALSGSTLLEVKPLNGSVQYDAETRVAKKYATKIKARWKQLLKNEFSDSGIFFDFNTMTPKAIIESFPKEGQKIGEDFEVTYSLAETAVDGFGRADFEILEFTGPRMLDELDPAWYNNDWPVVQFVKTPLDLAINVSHRYQVERTETAEFLFNAGIQDAVVGQETATEEINLRPLTGTDNKAQWEPQTQYAAGDEVVDGSFVYRARNDHVSGNTRLAAEWIQVGETNYISSRRTSSFLKSERGAEVIQHIEQRSRARARLASRCVYVDFEAQMPRNPNDVTPDCSVRIESSLLPGGFAEGRLVSYSLIWASGRWSFSGTIACAAGTGDSDSVVISEPEGTVRTPTGRFEITVQNNGDEQEQILVDSLTEEDNDGITLQVLGQTSVPETSIRFDAIPAPITSLEQSINVPISGVIGIEKQVDL